MSRPKQDSFSRSIGHKVSYCNVDRPHRHKNDKSLNRIDPNCNRKCSKHHDIKSALGNLSERERIIVDLRYGLSDKDGEERTQKEVADMLGISQSYISRLEKKIIGRLQSEIKKLG